MIVLNSPWHHLSGPCPPAYTPICPTGTALSPPLSRSPSRSLTHVSRPLDHATCPLDHVTCPLTRDRRSPGSALSPVSRAAGQGTQQEASWPVVGQCPLPSTLQTTRDWSVQFNSIYSSKHTHVIIKNIPRYMYNSLYVWRGHTRSYKTCIYILL